MSFDATKWAWQVIRVQDVSRELRAADVSVLLALADRHNKCTGRCDPSHAVLAADTRLTRRTVIKVVKRLKALGIIKARNRWGNGRQDTCEFTLFGTMLARPDARIESECGSPSRVNDVHINRGIKPGELQNRLCKRLRETGADKLTIRDSVRARSLAGEDRAMARTPSVVPGISANGSLPRVTTLRRFATMRGGVPIRHGVRLEVVRG